MANAWQNAMNFSVRLWYDDRVKVNGCVATCVLAFNNWPPSEIAYFQFTGSFKEPKHGKLETEVEGAVVSRNQLSSK